MWRKLFYHIKRAVKQGGEHSPEREISGPIDLDGESKDRFLRLKRKLPNLKDEEVLANALKSLEQKTDRIIRKIAVRKVRKLRSEGLSPEKIAEQLNRNGVPPVGETDRWYGVDVSDLQKKDFRFSEKPQPHHYSSDN